MNVEYDEDIGKNEFFIELTRRYERFYDRASKERWTVCVPCNKCKLNRGISVDDLENHILVLSEEEERKSLRTLHGKTARVENNTVKIDDDEKDCKIEATILFEETFYPKNGTNFQILCVDKYLVDISFDNMSPPLYTSWSLRECLEFLTREIDNKQIVSKIDRVITKWSTRYCNLEIETLTNIKELVTSLYTRILKALLLDNSMKLKIQDKDFLEHFSLSLESYILNKLYSNIFKGISFHLALMEAHLNKNIRNLSHIPLRALHSNPGLKTTVPRAVWEMSRLGQFTTPLDKLHCIARCIKTLVDPRTRLFLTKVNAENGESTKLNVEASKFVCDDLIPILVFVLLKSTTSNWYSHLTFMKEFRLSSTSKTSHNDEFSFYCASLEAAIECIKTGVLNCTSQEALLEPESNLGSLTSQNLCDLSKFFKCAKNGDLETFSEMLQKSEIHSPKTSACHPLCSCDLCEQNQRDTSLNVRTKDDNGNTALHMAAAYGKDLMIDFLLKHRARVDATNYGGQTPLHLACQRGHQKAVLLLLHNDADPILSDHSGNTALHLCTLNGHEDCVKAMVFYDEQKHHSRVNLNTANSFGDTPLHLAARWGYSNIVQLLVQYGASTEICNRRQETPMDCIQNLSVQRTLEKAIEDVQSQLNGGFIHIEPVYVNKSIERRKPIRAKPRGLSYSPQLFVSTKVNSLMKAVASGDINLVCYFLNIKTEPDDETDSFCHPLCQCDKCRNLLKGDSEDNRGRGIVSINCLNQQGWQPLHVAVANRQHLLVKILLQNGANVNSRTKDGGCTPLHLASQIGDTTVTEILLSHGASVDLVDFSGKSALSVALATGRTNIVAILMKVDLTTASGRSGGSGGANGFG